MKKNTKTIFFVLTLITMLILISGVTATDTSTNDAVSTDNSISEQTITTDSVVNKEKNINTPIKEVVNKTKEKQITKNNKTEENTKTATKTVEVNNLDELQTTVNNAVNDLENDEYIINLNGGIYSGMVNLVAGLKTPIIYINANNQTIGGFLFVFNNGCNITVQDAVFNTQIQNNNNEITLKNVVISRPITNSKTISIINSTLNGNINNNGKLFLSDDLIFQNPIIQGTGEIITDNISKVAPYMATFNGNYVLENMNFTRDITNYNNLTLINSSVLGISNIGILNIDGCSVNYLVNRVNAYAHINNSICNDLQDEGNAVILNSQISLLRAGGTSSDTSSNTTVINSTLNGVELLSGQLIIDDDTIFGENFYVRYFNLVDSGARFFYNDSTRIAPYMNAYYGNYILENVVITEPKTNNGVLMIRNSTVNTTITNNGNLTIADDVIMGKNAAITGTGKVITNNSGVTPYLSVYDGVYTLENVVITQPKTNNGVLMIRNSTINTTITNNGNLTIADDVIIGENTTINGTGSININNISRITPYINPYDGNYTLENIVLTRPKTNNGVLMIRNSTINTTITNNGNLFIADDVIIGENTVISGIGLVVSNNTGVIACIDTYNGNYTLENVILTKPKTNKGILVIRNSTLDNVITNDGVLIIMEDCVLGNNFQINAEANHVLISNITNVTSYITSFRGNHTLENAVITKRVTLNVLGRLIVYNSTVNNYFTNNGELVFINSVINSTISTSSSHHIMISSDTIITGNGTLTGSGIINGNASNDLYPYKIKFENGTLHDLEFNKIFTGINITIDNCTTTYRLALSNSTVSNSKISDLDIIEGNVIILDSIMDGAVNNDATLILDDDVIFGDNFSYSGNGEVIMNDTDKLTPYLNEYYGNVSVEDHVIDGNKINYNNLTLRNSTVNGIITNNGNLTLANSHIMSDIINNGVLIIDENTVFDENVQINGTGMVYADDITHILPHITRINGNYTIKDTVLNKTYIFNGRITLDNCTILKGNNINHGFLNITNSVINVSDIFNYWMENHGVILIENSTNMYNGEIIDYGEVFMNNLPENYTYNPNVHVIRENNFYYYFSSNGLNSDINAGDTLDFQGTIHGSSQFNVIINKPVNIITSTNDGKIENFRSINFYEGSSGSNVTGLTTYNTLFSVSHADHIVFDNISNIVENAVVGSNTGQTSIGRNSSYITLKNSYIYTKNNGGHSSLVIQWGSYCDIINNTIIGVGGVGNLLYITTYGVPVDIVSSSIPNHHNNLLNNTIIGPEIDSSICIGVAISGTDNMVDGNIIHYSGEGIGLQWGSGMDSMENGTTAIANNTITNNKLYGGCGITGGNYIYNNYVELGTMKAYKTNSYNNTVYNLELSEGTYNITNTTVLNNLIAKDTRTNAILSENNIKNILISSGVSNLIFTNNNINGTVYINGTGNIFRENNITSNEDYAFTGRGNNNTITNNNIISRYNGGDASVQLNPERNTIHDNMPISSIIGLPDDILGYIYEPINITFKPLTANNEVITTGNIKVTDAGANILLEQEVNGEEFNLELTFKQIGITTITAVYTDMTGEHINATHTVRVVMLVPEQSTKLSDEKPVLGESTSITAAFFQQDGTPANGGKAFFRVNGKTLRDDNGDVIYVDVVNGYAQPLNVNITGEWMKPDTTIQAIYTGDDLFEPTFTAKTPITVTKPTANITITSDNEVKIGESITLTAKITDNKGDVTTGRVVFKLNGKTLKDENGKAIYVNVVNGVATTTYTIPSKTRAKEYTLSAVFTDILYERSETEEQIVVTK